VGVETRRRTPLTINAGAAFSNFKELMPGGAPKRILCVEDNPDLCELIAAVLTEYQVISASGESDAWRRYGSQKFSLILLDYHLEEGDGLTLCERIREKDLQTPIVFITSDEDLTEEQVREAGAQRLIKKSNHRFVDNVFEIVEMLSVEVA
jgi:CheY-like chemotaxis protein